MIQNVAAMKLTASRRFLLRGVLSVSNSSTSTHRMAVGGRVLASDVVFQLAFDIAQQA